MFRLVLGAGSRCVARTACLSEPQCQQRWQISLTSGGGVLDFGRHAGMTFEECFQKHPNYCDWLLKQPENLKTAAFRKYLEDTSRNPSPNSWSSSQPQRASSSSYKRQTVQVPQLSPSASTPHADGLQAAAEVINFGRYKGRSYDDVCREDPQYAQWMVQQAQKPDASPSAKSFADFVAKRFPTFSASSVSSSTLEGTPPPPPAPPAASGFAAQRFNRTPANGWNQNSSRRDGKGLQQSGSPIISGLRVLGGGTYPTKTYAEVFECHPTYCKWLVNWAVSESTSLTGWHWPFIAYVQHRWLCGRTMAPEPVTVTGKTGCLDGCRCVVTGSPSEMKRHELEELIVFFGGKVLGACSANTTYLVAGQGHLGQSIEAGFKYARAQQLDIPVLQVSELLALISTTSGSGVDATYVSGGHEVR